MANNPEKPIGEANNPQENPKDKIGLGTLLGKELTPTQRAWIFRVLIGSILSAGAVGGIGECSKNAGMMRIIEKNGGEKVPLFNDNYISGDWETWLKNNIPEGRREEKPVTKEVCGRKVILLPYCMEQLEFANQEMEARFAEVMGASALSHPVDYPRMKISPESYRCIKVNLSGRTNREQYNLFRKSISLPEGQEESRGFLLTREDVQKLIDSETKTMIEAAKFPKEIIEKMKKSFKGTGITADELRKIIDPQTGWLVDEDEFPIEIVEKMKKSFVVAPPSQSIHERFCAVDVDNWKQAGKHLRKHQFMGGSSFFGIKKGIPDDLCHFSIGEFNMSNPVQRIQKKIKKGGKRHK